MADRVVVITGPTATGKTKLGVALAKRFGGEVVSADSMQLYRRMDIGTAKPTPAEKEGVPHHMMDVAEPEEAYSVSRYVAAAAACVDDILARGRLPLIVGGTGLYIDSLIAGRTFAPRGEDTALREKYGALYDEKGGEAMLDLLAAGDPARAAKLHPHDKKRIVRALEVLEGAGTALSAHDEETKKRPPRYEAATIVLDYADRADLYARIDRRVDEMMAAGLADEVARLLAAGVPPEATAMQAIGYKELAAALAGEGTLEEAAETVKRASRRYAKRQLSWCGRYRDACRIRWGKVPDFDEGLRISTEFLHSAGLL